jgi:electron transfer flavoprotein alpha subunit
MSVLAFVELTKGHGPHRMFLETAAAGQQIAAALGTDLEFTTLSSDLSIVLEVEEGAIEKTAKIWTIQHDALEDYTADGYTAALEELIRKINPVLVLFPHTYQVRDFAPKLATRFGRPFISDVIAIRKDGDSLVFVRQLFQGKLNGDVTVSGEGPHFVSIQAGAWRADLHEPFKSTTEEFTPALDSAAIRQKPEAPFRESARAVDLTAAELIVSVGRGIKEKDNIGMVEDLARVMGAELAASRPICDAGWLPMERQVGSSGQTVSPKLYLAIGISGAIQHLVGMKGAKTIVAINKDANAPIFEVADYGIVGDLFEVVPALIEEVKKAKA